LGVPEASTDWAFADGAVDDGHSERIVVYNPSDQRAEVEVSVLPTTDEGAPAPQPFRLSIRAGDFAVVDYGAEKRIAVGIGHATMVRSTNGVPVVAERAMTQAVGGDDGDGESEESSEGGDRAGDITAGPGSVVAASRWAFSSAGDGGEGSVLRFVVFNPDPERATRATLVAVVDGRQHEIESARDVEVPPGGRVTLEEDGADESGPVAGSGDAGWLVESTAPVVAERVLVGGHDLRLATGVGLPSADGAVPLARLVGA
jgi:hypothetical protein